jgi:hypothetical protein
VTGIPELSEDSHHTVLGVCSAVWEIGQWLEYANAIADTPYSDH